MASYLPGAEHYPHGYYNEVKPSPFYDSNAVSVIQQPYVPVIQPQPVYNHHQPFPFDGCMPASFYYYHQTASASVPAQPIHSIPNNPTQDELRAESEDNVVRQKKRTPNAKRGRPTKNPVWTLFQRIDEKSVLCNMCGRVVKSACATNMTKHIERHHQDVEDLPRDMYQHPQQTVSMTNNTGEDFSGWTNDRRPAKRHRRTKHPVWELFCRAEDGTARCIICQAIVRSPCSSNFMGHLNRHHMDHYQSIYQRWVDNRSMDPL